MAIATAATIATGLAAWGALLSATLGTVSAVEQHKQAEANAEAQARQSEYNQRLADREAARTDAETVENARRQREESNILKARQRALLGKSGAAMSSGSPLAVLGATAADEELKTQDLLSSGYAQAQQYREQAKMYQYQAGVARSSAPSSLSRNLAIAGSWTQAAGTIGSAGLRLAGSQAAGTPGGNAASTPSTYSRPYGRSWGYSKY